MPQDVGAHGTSTDELRRLAEANQWRTEQHFQRIGSALCRVEHRLLMLETTSSPSSRGGGRTWTTSQLWKLSIGLMLPLAVLALTGNVELAKRIMQLMTP